MSKKRIRMLVKQHLPTKTIGGRIFIERKALEDLLSNSSNDILSLNQ